MLNFKEIQKHFNSEENRTPRLVLMEYLQYKVLEIIFASPYGNRLVFLGGTCIRIVYGGSRFSEDLDLDNKDFTENEFADLTGIVKQELEKEGIKTEFRNVYRGAYHCYLKFPRILFENKLSALQDEKILVKIDSGRSRDFQKAVSVAIAKADIFSEIRTYPQDLLLAQKINTLFNRKRAKGRDIFDVLYLFPMTEPDYEYLKKKLRLYSREELLKQMRQLFSDKELAALARDVEPFLVDPSQSERIKKFNLWLDTQLRKM